MKVIRFRNMDELTYDKIVSTMKRMIDREKYESFHSFNNNEYHWEIDFDVLKRLKDTNPDIGYPSEINEILGIKVGRILYRHPEICLIKDTNDCVPIMNASRGCGKTNMQLKYLEEMMKKWNRGIVNNNRSIENVIFNDPATIVFWSDGTKTVVKAEGEPFDPEKGLAMAITKKSLGNQGNYYNEFKKWLPEREKKEKEEKKFTIRYYTVKELSEIFNISRDKVRNNIKNGLYPNAIKQSGAWLIPYNDFKSVLLKKNCSTCEYVTSPVSPYDDPLHPCNLCGSEKRDD